ncbi:MAG TPA: glycosyltransferase [Draconibacterium sp.]|nr:glycosyltransferase [Draconibacterium sp.]
MKRKKQIIVSVTNDLISDNRVHKVCSTLEKIGFSVLLVGRKLSGSQPIKRSYQTHRMSLLFTKGACFYAEFNFRLFLLLLFRSGDIFLANDLDTLTANFLASKLKRKPLVYDSHEYFTEVPELIGRPRVKRFWEWLEAKMVPHLKHCYTVCNSIAGIYNKKYNTTFKVVRNIPLKNQENKVVIKNSGINTLLYQGALNIGRGLEQAIKAMHFVNNTRLIIAGDGDIKEKLEDLVYEENLGEKVEFTGRLSIEKLNELTPTADLGLSIEEDLGLNYRYALPNKLFDYIHAGVPVLVSNLPEMKTIVDQYQIGEVCNSHHPKELAQNINESISNSAKRKLWQENLKLAAKELTWENEEKVLTGIFSAFK